MKLLVNITIPAVSENYDVFVPGFLKVSEVVSLIVEALAELTSHRYISSGHEFLCLREQNLLLRQDETLEAYKIKNGDHLVLI